MSRQATTTLAPVRRPAVAGSFYPADPVELTALVADLLAGVDRVPGARLEADRGVAGILVPHAGLAYSGPVAAAAWRPALTPPIDAATPPPTLVMLGTNHGATWLDGIGAWDHGPWRTPLGDIAVDEDLANAITALGSPFVSDRDAHRSEHSLEVQLPFVASLARDARIVPLAVSTGSGAAAIDAGGRLGTLLAERRRRGVRIALVISTDMAHYPPAAIAEAVTDALEPWIVDVDPMGLARGEAEVTRAGLPGVVCGMCGIEPSVVGLAALRAMGVERGVRVAAATSAAAGGPADRTVGYLAVAFPG